MTEKLKVFSGTTFEMVTYPGLPEPSEFSAILASLLTRAEWSIWLHPGRHSLLGIGSGVIIVVSTQAPPRADEAGKALLASLISEGVAAKLGYDSLKVNPIKIAIQIQVGTKQ